MSKPPATGLNLGFTKGDRRENVEQNRRLLFEQLGAQRFSLASLRQAHSRLIYQVTCRASGKLDYHSLTPPSPAQEDHRPPAGDGLVTHQAGILLSVRTADCLPLLLVDPHHRAVGAAHAGWRGALEGIVEKAVGHMARVFGSEPHELLAAVGPSIRACCYEVGEEVVDAYCSRFKGGEEFFRQAPTSNPSTAPVGVGALRPLPASSAGQRRPRTPATHLDLVAVARHQLEGAGIPPASIEVADFCTACRTDLFFSHRKEGSHTGRVMAVIAIRPDSEQ